jgi:hypothetical protein
LRPHADDTHASRTRRHKSTGQAVVTINGRHLYLGKWNSAASRADYDRLIAVFLANGRQLRSDFESTVVEIIKCVPGICRVVRP